MELRTFGRTAQNHGTHELYFNRPVGRMKTNIMLDSRGLPGMPGFGRAPGDGGGCRLLFPLHIRTETLIASKETRSFDPINASASLCHGQTPVSQPVL